MEKMTMKKNTIGLTLLAIIMILAMGVIQISEASTVQLEREITTDIPGGDYTADQIEKAIYYAAKDRGWIPVKLKGRNIVECTLIARGHTLTVDIIYGASKFTIQYKSSNNLKYNPIKNTIHSKYKYWTNNLKIDILQHIALTKTN